MRVLITLVIQHKLIEYSEIRKRYRTLKFNTTTTLTNSEYVLIEKLPDKTETELLTEIESSLVKSIRTYCSGGCEDNVIWGKDAIYEMFKEIQAHIDKEGAYEVNYQLRIYGFLATKKMLLSMLQKEVRWQTVALQYEEIVQEWDCICMFF